MGAIGSNTVKEALRLELVFPVFSTSDIRYICNPFCQNFKVSFGNTYYYSNIVIFINFTMYSTTQFLRFYNVVSICFVLSELVVLNCKMREKLTYLD